MSRAELQNPTSGEAKPDIGRGESALGGVDIGEPERRGTEQGVVAP